MKKKRGNRKGDERDKGETHDKKGIVQAFPGSVSVLVEYMDGALQRPLRIPLVFESG